MARTNEPSTTGSRRARRAVADTLFDLAAEHSGFFTIAEAQDQGLSRPQLTAQCKSGILERRSRGVYRFRNYPRVAREQFIEAVLWPRTHQRRADVLDIVVSHQSALDVLGISDANPAQIHITVPKTMRIRRKIPQMYAIHYADIDPNDIMGYDDIPVTNVRRTIHDCVAAGVSARILLKAITDAIERDFITETSARQLRKEIEAR